MIYRNRNELLDAICACDVSEVEKLKHLGDLFTVYYNALNNAPEYIIGVGCISYAEQMLIAAQDNA